MTMRINIITGKKEVPTYTYDEIITTPGIYSYNGGLDRLVVLPPVTGRLPLVIAMSQAGGFYVDQSYFRNGNFVFTVADTRIELSNE